MAPQSWQVGMLPLNPGENSDYGPGEAYPPRYGHTYASFVSCFLGGLKPGFPWQGVTSRYTRDINDHTVRPLADMRWETFTYLSHGRSEEHTSELQSRLHLVCRLLLEKKKKDNKTVNTE